MSAWTLNVTGGRGVLSDHEQETVAFVDLCAESNNSLSFEVNPYLGLLRVFESSQSGKVTAWLPEESSDQAREVLLFELQNRTNGYLVSVGNFLCTTMFVFSPLSLCT